MKIVAMAAGAAALLLTGGVSLGADDERPLDHLDMAIKNIKRQYKIDATGPFDTPKKMTILNTTCNLNSKDARESRYYCTINFNIADQFSSDMRRTADFLLIHNLNHDIWIAE